MGNWTQFVRAFPDRMRRIGRMRHLPSASVLVFIGSVTALRFASTQYKLNHPGFVMSCEASALGGLLAVMLAIASHLETMGTRLPDLTLLSRILTLASVYRAIALRQYEQLAAMVSSMERDHYEQPVTVRHRELAATFHNVVEDATTRLDIVSHELFWSPGNMGGTELQPYVSQLEAASRGGLAIIRYLVMPRHAEYSFHVRRAIAELLKAEHSVGTSSKGRMELYLIPFLQLKAAYPSWQQGYNFAVWSDRTGRERCIRVEHGTHHSDQNVFNNVVIASPTQELRAALTACEDFVREHVGARARPSELGISLARRRELWIDTPRVDVAPEAEPDKSYEAMLWDFDANASARQRGGVGLALCLPGVPATELRFPLPPQTTLRLTARDHKPATTDDTRCLNDSYRLVWAKVLPRGQGGAPVWCAGLAPLSAR